MVEAKSQDEIITRDDLPSLYRTATIASGDAQNSLLRLTKFSILFLTFGALSSSLNLFGPNNESWRFWAAMISAVTLLLSIGITFYLEQSKYEKKWYEGRAIAESVKTISWRFVVNSEPYLSIAKDAEKKFIEDLKEILKERKSFADLLGGDNATQPQITEKMRKIRKMKVEERLKIYISNRIMGQKDWYSKNSKNNRENGQKFFLMIISLQILATIVAFLLVKYPSFILNPVGIFTTSIAGLLAWTQLKQYRTLAESYGLTAQELGLIEEQSRGIKKKEELSNFVIEAETAISREHTSWLARKVFTS